MRERAMEAAVEKRVASGAADRITSPRPARRTFNWAGSRCRRLRSWSRKAALSPSPLNETLRLASPLSSTNSAPNKVLTADMSARKEEVKQQIQQELAVASAQQLVTKMTENVSVWAGGARLERAL